MLPVGSLSTGLLIFGGCCSNVFALEAIVKSEPSSGLLITFFQFVFAALVSCMTQVSTAYPYGVRQPSVPLRRWGIIAVMFWTINMLNNWAFAFSISVPVHIILRSFGSVTTMLMGYLRGKRYSMLQVLSVVLLTVGVLCSAWADSESKGNSMDMESKASTSEFTTGLAILLLAQFLAAFQGAYVEDTYAMYKAEWVENLFYSHALGLPLFLPFSSSLREQFTRLTSTSPLDLQSTSFMEKNGTLRQLVPNALVTSSATLTERLPRGVLFLLINAVTQLVCISGVNLLAAKSSAVTVTIALNIRKLVSFILSTILFGHHLSGRMILGSALVFGSGALYGWETTWRLPRERKQEASQEASQADGAVEKKE